jgi:hypothetical protein
MSAQQVVVEFYLALERATGEGNAPKARRAARAIGFHFDNRQAAKWLQKYVAEAEKRRAGPNTGATAGPPYKEAQAQVQARTESAHDKGIPNSKPPVSGSIEPSTPLMLPSMNGSVPSENGHRRRRNGKPPDTAWIAPMAQAAKALADKRLDALTVEERFVVARWHVFKFANCNKSEAHNRAKAALVATGLTRLAQSREYASLTVLDYIGMALETWELSGRVPIYSAWRATAAIEV